MPSIVENLMKRHDDMKPRENWETRWRDVLELVLPDKDDVWERFSKSSGREKGDKIFDNSPGHFLELQASALHTMLTPPDKLWHEFSSGDVKLDKESKVRKYFRDLQLLNHDIINNSNFHTQIHEYYLDLGSIGTAMMALLEDDEDVVHYVTSPIYNHWIDENHKGRVDTVTSEVQFTGRQLLQKYGTKPFNAEHLKKFIDKPNEKYLIQNTILPRKDIKLGKFGATNKKFGSFHIWRDEKILLRESGFATFPVVVSRWIKITGEKYGRSSAMKALHDIRMLNRMMEDTLRAAQKATDPPLMLPDDGVFPKPNINPGGLNFYRAGSEDKIFPLNTGSNPGVGLDMIADVRQRIKEAFFVDKLQLVFGDRATATEVNSQIDEQLRLYGPQLARMTDELLRPLVIRQLSILEKKGMLPDKPEELEGIDLIVVFNSQLARAQKLSEGANFARFIEASGPIATIQPEVTNNIDGDKAIKYLANIHGIPEEIFRDDKEVASLREEQASGEEADAAAQRKLVEAETIQKAGSGLKAVTG